MQDKVPLPSGCVQECRACRHRSWSMEDSLRQKQDFLSRTLAPWSDQLRAVRSVPAEQRWGYRGKVKLAARWLGHEWTFGMEPRDEFIAIPQCPVQSSMVTSVLAIIGKAMPSAELWPLRFIVQNGALLTLILKCHILPDTGWLTSEVVDALHGVGLRGLHVNLHPAAGRILFAKRGWHRLWGESRVQDDLGQWHGPGVFQQLIPSLYAESLDFAEQHLAPNSGDTVLDLYSGIGGSMKRWLRRKAQVVGIECDGEAIECAQLNAPDALVLRGLCAQRLPQLRAHVTPFAAEHRLIYANPPRLGLEPEILSWTIRECRPHRIAYLSCSPGTLRRDLLALTEAGYEVTALHPFDFFPQTHHVETLALLRRID